MPLPFVRPFGPGWSFGMRLLASWCAPLALGSALSAQFPYPPDIPEAEVHVYKQVGEVELRAWVLRPATPNPEPAAGAILFFGGGWNAGSPAQFLGQARHLVSRGMVVVLPEYRVRSRHGTSPADSVEDAKSALRWVRARAGELGMDPGRILVGGGSAGGHLAVATALLPGFDGPEDDLAVSCRPDALVLFNPVVVLAPVPGLQTRSEQLEQFAARAGADPSSLSPFHHLAPEAPPCLILHGTADTTVPFVTVEAFTRRSQELGNRCELVPYDGAEHGFFNQGRGGNLAYEDTLRRLDAFLVSLGFLPPRTRD